MIESDIKRIADCLEKIAAALPLTQTVKEAPVKKEPVKKAPKAPVKEAPVKKAPDAPKAPVKEAPKTGSIFAAEKPPMTVADLNLELQNESGRIGADGIPKIKDIMANEPFNVVSIEDLKPEQYQLLIDAAKECK